MHRIGGYRFHSYSDEEPEPSYIHVRSFHGECTFWLDPVQLARTRRLGPNDLREIEQLVYEFRKARPHAYRPRSAPDRWIDLEPIGVRAWVHQRLICVELTDTRVVCFPAERFAALRNATNEQLGRIALEVDGYALRWEDIDEDLTVPGVVAGRFQLPLAT
jgi:hypothetical protein